MQRRVVLAAVVLAVLASLAGCSAAGSIDMTAVNDTELADEASRSLDPEVPGRDAANRSRASVVRSAVANGSTTVDGVRPPISDGLPFAVDGAYYDLERSVVDRREADLVDVGVDYESTAPNGTAVDYGDLPRADRDALDGLLPPRERFRTGDTVGVSAMYSDADLEASVLAPVQQYDAVVFDGERYAIHVEEPRPVTVQTYRYSATEVAPNAADYAAGLESRYEFTLSGLSGGERSVIESAIDDAYYADSGDDEAFASVLERFRARERITGDGASGVWLVRYDGERYVADLQYGGFLGE